MIMYVYGFEYDIVFLSVYESLFFFCCNVWYVGYDYWFEKLKNRFF